MQVASVIIVLFCAILGVLTAPTVKPGADIAKEMADELKQFKSKLSSLDDEFKNIMDAVKKNSNPTAKRQLSEKSSAEDEKHEDKAEKEPSEPDPFISRVAKKVASKVSLKDPPAYIEGLVNMTAKHLVEKMNASHGDISEFKNKLKAAVLKLLNERSMDYEPVEKESTAFGGVNPSKVMEAIDEILRGPLISGFVSKEEEELMIRRSVEALSKDFGLSKMAEENLIHAMTSYAAKELGSLAEEKDEPVEPMDDGEKILGLEKMVEDKVEEKILNLKEAKLVAKGLAAAVGARNKLSYEKTKELEKILSEGVEKYMRRKQDELEITDISLLDDKKLPEGFREAVEAKRKRDYDFGGYMKGYGSAGENENLFALLRKLQGKWDKVKYSKGSDAAKKSALEAKKKETEKLKEALKNSIAEMDKLSTEKKKDNGSQKRSAIASVFVHCVSVEPVSSVNCPVSIERGPDEPKPTEAAGPTAGDNIVSKVGHLSFGLAKQIQEAAAAIQQELEKEVEEREKENEKKEKELVQQEKESEVEMKKKIGTEKKKEDESQKRTVVQSTEAKPTQAASPTGKEDKIVSKIGALSSGLAKQIEKAAAELQKNIEKEIKKQKKENEKQKEKQLAEQEKEKMKQQKEADKEKMDQEKLKEKEKMDQEKQKEKQKQAAGKDKKEEDVEKEKEDEKEKEKEKEENEKEKEKEKEENAKEKEKEKEENEKEKEKEKVENEKEKEKEKEENAKEKEKEKEENEKEKEKEKKENEKEKEENAKEKEKEKEEKEKEKEENEKEKEKEKEENAKEKEKEKEEESKEEGEEKKEGGEEKESEAEAEKKESEVAKESEKIEDKIAKENEKIEDSKEEKEKDGKRDQVSKDKITKTANEIEKELDEANLFELSETTAEPTTASKQMEEEAENELMAELDDIFQIKN